MTPEDRQSGIRILKRLSRLCDTAIRGHGTMPPTISALEIAEITKAPTQREMEPMAGYEAARWALIQTNYYVRRSRRGRLAQIKLAMNALRRLGK